MDLIEQFHRRILLAMRERPNPAASPPTIGEIYQSLAPYRSVRSELGVWELAEYEHILLRFLAGEGGHAVVEDGHVRDEILRELASPNPILGIYRDYPGVEVSVEGAPSMEPAAAAPVAPAPEPEEEPEPIPVLSADTAPAAPPAPAPADRSEDPPLGEWRAEQSPARACTTCGEGLPGVSDLRFCPACGSDQAEAPCAGCGTMLRPEWNFCIRCGRRRAERPAEA